MHNHEFQTVESGDSRELCELFGRVWRLIYSNTLPDSVLLHMTILQVRCLRTVSENQGENIAAMAQRMGISLPSASRMVDRLVRDGFVEKCDDPNDRRVKRVYLTNAAHTALDQVTLSRLNRFEKCMKNLSPQGAQLVMEGMRLLSGAAGKVE